MIILILTLIKIAKLFDDGVVSYHPYGVGNGLIWYSSIILSPLRGWEWVDTDIFYHPATPTGLDTPKSVSATVATNGRSSYPYGVE